MKTWWMLNAGVKKVQLWLWRRGILKTAMVLWHLYFRRSAAHPRFLKRVVTVRQRAVSGRHGIKKKTRWQLLHDIFVLKKWKQATDFIDKWVGLTIALKVYRIHMRNKIRRFESIQLTRYLARMTKKKKKASQLYLKPELIDDDRLSQGAMEREKRRKMSSNNKPRSCKHAATCLIALKESRSGIARVKLVVWPEL